MKIAVTYENGQIFQHFGHTEKIKIYEVENDKIISETIIDTSESGHELLVNVLKDNNVDTLICGGLGQGAKNALEEANITLYAGISGEANEAVNELIKGTLERNSEANCCGHEHEESEEHQCENHGRCDKKD